MITISSEKYGISKVVKATQGAFVPTITIEPETLTFAVEGGTQEVAVTANFDEYEFSTNVDWLTIEKSEKGVNISATQNTKFEECIAEITISNNKYSISKTISVVQKGVSAKPENVIIYTSSDGKIVTPYRGNVFGANIVSNIYSNVHGQGIIIFDAPVTSIGMLAFEGCSSLTSVTIGDSVTSIGYAAFRDCTSLKAFYGKFASADNRCLVVDGTLHSFAPAGLTQYTISDSVTSIESSAFEGCSSLTSVTIPDSVTSIGDSAFSGCPSLTGTYVNITDLAAYAISNNTHRFPGNKHLLVNGTEITELVIPDSVTSIGGYAFYGWTSLTSVTIPDSVISIGGQAFYQCTSLKSVTIPDSVTAIGALVFQNCTSLKEVYCKPTTPPTGGSSMFDNNASGRTIYVPRCSVWAYKSAKHWNYYADYIEEKEF